MRVSSIRYCPIFHGMRRLAVFLIMIAGGLSLFSCRQQPAPAPLATRNPSDTPTVRVAGGAPPATSARTTQATQSMLKQDYTTTPIPLAITLAPVTPTQGAQLRQASQGKKGQPLQVGFGRAIPAAYQTDLLSRLAWTTLDNGAVVSAFTVTSPQARSLRLKLASTTLAEAIEIRFFRPGATDQIFGPFTQKQFLSQPASSAASVNPPPVWSPIIEGDTIGVEIYAPSAQAVSTSSLNLLQVSHMR